MSDTLANRVGRLVGGGVHALLDAMERAAPEAVMAQAIREVDSVVDEVRTELAKSITERHMAVKRLAEENRRFEELAQNAELAITKGEDELAEVAVGRQLDIEAQLPVIEQRIQECTVRQQELESFILALQARRREMDEELRTIVATRKEAENQAAQTSCAQVEIGVHKKAERAASAFERARENVAGVSVGTGSPVPQDAKKLRELDNLARQNRIQERLAAVKAKITK